MKPLHLLFVLFLLTALSACHNFSNNPVPSEKPVPPAPTTPCNEINHCLISCGFDYKSVATVIFRTYKKNTNFSVFLKEYKAKMDRDFLAEQQPDSWENKRKERNIYIPDEINSDVDFILITTDSLKYKIGNIKTHWEAHYGNSFVGYGCEMYYWELNEKADSSGGNIYIFKPGFYLK